MINALSSLKLEKRNEIPGEFKSRFEKLITAPKEERGDHTVATISRQISWLYYLDPDWVNERVMPWFNFDHAYSGPAWSGYLSANKIHTDEIGVALKPLFLDLFPKVYQWSLNPNISKIATQITIYLAVFHSNEPYGLNDREARHCLRNMNDTNRQDAVDWLNQLRRGDAEESSEHVISFIKEVWPLERAFKTSKLVSSWVSLLGNSGDKFPEVLSVVHRNLVPVNNNYWLDQFSMSVGERQPLATQYPEDVLEMLDAIVPSSVEDTPYKLSDILVLVEEAEPFLIGDHRFKRLVALVENA